MKNKYAYTRQVGSQSETPSFFIEDDGSWLIDGYQNYKVSCEGLLVNEKVDHKVKFEAIAPFMDLLKKYRFVDMGCSAGYIGIQALLHGAHHVSFVDHDLEYIELTKSVLEHLKLSNCEYSCSTVSDYKKEHDVAFVFALIHWIYSYSDTFGSLQAIVAHFARLATHTLFIEWIDPNDPVMNLANHIYQNPERISDTYTKENFLKALLEHYSTVVMLKEITPTRQIYIATKMLNSKLIDNIHLEFL